MYKGYTLESLMAMHTVTFFALLSEGYRQHNMKLLEDALTATVPHMDEEPRKDYIDKLVMLTDDGDTIEEEESSVVDQINLMKILNGQ